MTGSREGVRVRIAGTGLALPERVLTNAELEKIVETTDEWIVRRTGIRERRLASPEETTSVLATRAASEALERAGCSPRDVDMILVATITPDNVFPCTACHVQRRLGVGPCAAFDVSAACAGFLHALTVGWRMIAGGAYRNVLVIGAETMSRITDYTDRSSCILFGDGAGAVLLVPAGKGEGEILSSYLAADGSDEEVMIVPAGGSRIPASHESIDARLHYMRLDGRKVFKFAVATYRELVERTLAENGFTTADLGLLIPHQVNARIIESAQKKLDIPDEKVFVNIDRYGNTSAASVPIALAEADRAGRIRPGELLLMIAFGAGLAWGSVLVRW